MKSAPLGWFFVCETSLQQRHRLPRITMQRRYLFNAISLPISLKTVHNSIYLSVRLQVHKGVFVYSSKRYFNI